MEGKIIFFLLCCTVILSFAESQTNLDDLIKNIFTVPNESTTPTSISSVPLQPSTSPTFQPTPTKTTILNPGNNPNPNNQQYKSCGYEKECVPRFLCNNNQINNDGTNLIDIRIDGVECQYLEVCCDIPNKTTSPVIPIVPPVQHDGCGYRNPDGVGFKIEGGENNEAEFGEFPWMVAILREEEAPGEILNLYECGGALISPTVVVTASHCVQTRIANTLVVRAGEWDTQTKTEVLPHQDRRVKEIIVHERYNKGALFNDIALLIVDSPFQWEENIRPLCLPESNVNFDYSRCYATGWGKDTFGREGTYQVILKKIDLPVVPRDQCQANLRKTRLGLYFNLHESFLCAGGEIGKDTCKGDGGSPLVCPIPGAKNRFYHAGIVAWGIGCGEENVPGVYASIPFLRQWINEKLTTRGINFEHFTI